LKEISMASFSYTLPVRFHDVDAAGIVFFPLDSPFLERDYGLPLVHAEADFHAPIRLGQEVHVDLTLASTGTSSFRVTSRLTAADGTPFATVRTVHVCVAPRTLRPIPLPDAMRSAFDRYLT
jgi:acyl-CoA thioesterase FadM